MDSRIRLGRQVVVSGGVDNGKIGTVVSPNRIKTDGRNIPINTISGDYKPVDYTRASAIELMNGDLITMFDSHLRIY